MDNLAFLDTAVEVLRILIAEPASGLVFLGVFVILYEVLPVFGRYNLCVRIPGGEWSVRAFGRTGHKTDVPILVTPFPFSCLTFTQPSLTSFFYPDRLC